MNSLFTWRSPWCRRRHCLRWFLSIAHPYYAQFSRHEHMHVQNIRDFPQTKLYSEINAPFLLNEHSDPHFLFHNFNENNILNNREKKIAEIYGSIFGKWNKYYRERHKGQKNAGYLKTFFLGRRWINNQRKSNSVWYNTLYWKIIELICCTQRLPKVT